MSRSNEVSLEPSAVGFWVTYLALWPPSLSLAFHKACELTAIFHTLLSCSHRAGPVVHK